MEDAPKPERGPPQHPGHQALFVVNVERCQQTNDDAVLGEPSATTQVLTGTHSHAHTRTHTHEHIHIHTRAQKTLIHTETHTTHTHTHARARARTHTHTHTHTHTPAGVTSMRNEKERLTGNAPGHESKAETGVGGKGVCRKGLDGVRGVGLSRLASHHHAVAVPCQGGHLQQ